MTAGTQEGFSYLINMLNGLIPSGFNFDDSYVSKRDFASHILFWAYKNVYVEKQKRKSFADHTGLRIDDDSYERESRKYHRALIEIANRKNEDAQRNGTPTGYYETLLKKEKQGKEVRASYHYSNLDKYAFDLLNTNTGLKLLSLLRDGRIPDSKKVSGYDIENAHKEYCCYIKEAGKRDLDSTEWIENLISADNSNADPFLIATAALREGAIVVTDERLGDIKTNDYRIPNVCQALSIPYINLRVFLDRILE